MLLINFLENSSVLPPHASYWRFKSSYNEICSPTVFIVESTSSLNASVAAVNAASLSVASFIESTQKYIPAHNAAIAAAANTYGLARTATFNASCDVVAAVVAVVWAPVAAALAIFDVVFAAVAPVFAVSAAVFATVATVAAVSDVVNNAFFAVRKAVIIAESCCNALPIVIIVFATP